MNLDFDKIYRFPFKDFEEYVMIIDMSKFETSVNEVKPNEYDKHKKERLFSQYKKVSEAIKNLLHEQLKNINHELLDKKWGEMLEKQKMEFVDNIQLLEL